MYRRSGFKICISVGSFRCLSPALNPCPQNVVRPQKSVTRCDITLLVRFGCESSRSSRNTTPYTIYCTRGTQQHMLQIRLYTIQLKPYLQGRAPRLPRPLPSTNSQWCTVLTYPPVATSTGASLASIGQAVLQSVGACWVRRTDVPGMGSSLDYGSQSVRERTSACYIHLVESYRT